MIKNLNEAGVKRRPVLMGDPYQFGYHAKLAPDQLATYTNLATGRPD